jgi:hypothetical protein
MARGMLFQGSELGVLLLERRKKVRSGPIGRCKVVSQHGLFCFSPQFLKMWRRVSGERPIIYGTEGSAKNDDRVDYSIMKMIRKGLEY